MYKLLLIRKYLGRKIAPMFAALAVTLCTAMVIIVISVMGGFLSMLRDAAYQLTGDVVVGTNAYNGFPHYQELVKKLEAKPAIDLATPIVETLGLVRLDDQSVGVQIMGVKAGELNKVVRYRESLYWTSDKYFNYTPPRQKSVTGDNGTNTGSPTSTKDASDTSPDLGLMESGMTFTPSKAMQRSSAGSVQPGLVLGIEANPRSRRDREGNYQPLFSSVGQEVVLTVVPVAPGGQVSDTELKRFRIVNEFKSGVHEIDSRRAYVDFSTLQKMLHMNPAEKVDPQTGEPTGETIPGRAKQIMAKAASGFSAVQARDAAEAALTEMRDTYSNLPPMGAMTWKERHSTLITAVQNERNLVLFLFGIISLVAIVMVAQTFYMIVLEKTRDIGVLRAVGASKAGIMQMYLGYGLAIGIVGGLAGLAIAWGIVTNLNEIQDLIARWFGWRMWSPKVYTFDEIPDQVAWVWAGWIYVGFVIASVLGALVPAMLAARLNPVEAIRHE